MKATLTVASITVVILQDPGMQELLPFGEYVSPEQTQSAHNLIADQFEAWELLARYAVTNAAPGLNTGRRRGQPRAEPVTGALPNANPGPILGTNIVVFGSGSHHMRWFCLQLKTQGQMLAAPAVDNLMLHLTKLLHQMASQMVPRIPPAGLPTQLVESHKRYTHSSCMQKTFLLFV